MSDFKLLVEWLWASISPIHRATLFLGFAPIQWLPCKFASFNPLLLNETPKHYVANVTGKRSYPYFAVCTRLSQFWINWAILLHFAFPGPIWQTCNIFIATPVIWILTQSPARPCQTLLQNVWKTNAACSTWGIQYSNPLSSTIMHPNFVF